MQTVDLAQLAQHLLADFQTVGNGGGLRQVEQRVRQVFVLDVELHPANQVGLVLGLGQIARRRAGGAFFRQGKHRRSVRRAVDERIGVNRDKQIGVDLACLGHPHPQRNEHIFVAGQEYPHIGLRFDAALELFGDLQHHDFFFGARRPDGARVFAAVARVQHNGDRPAIARGFFAG